MLLEAQALCKACLQACEVDVAVQARRWREHESRAQTSASLARQHVACGNNNTNILTELTFNLSFTLAWLCVSPLVWAGQQARYCYLRGLRNLPSYKSELSAATAKHQVEKAELQQKLLYQLAMQRDAQAALAAAARQLAAKDSELAALQTSGRAAQSEVDRVQRQLDASTAAYSDVQRQLDSCTYQSEQMQQSLHAKDAEIATVRASQQSALKEQEQQHQEALHAVKEAAEALVSQVQHQSAAANAAADADHCSKQNVLRNLQRDRDLLSSTVEELEQQKAALLSDGLSYMQQLRGFQDQVLGWQQAYVKLQQDAQAQLAAAHQEANEKDRQEEALSHMMRDTLEDLQQAQLAAQEAEAAEKKVLDELYPVHYAEVTIHSWPALQCYDSS